jgi:DNA repair protein RadD
VRLIRHRLVDSACAEIVQHTHDRQSCLIFASGVQHGRHVARVFQEKHSQECGFVCGDMPSAERDELLSRFRSDLGKQLFERPPLKYLCNVNVLTTGFDAPNFDCVVLLRPTMSPGLYYQMVGRGFRLYPGKQNGLVLDFGGNLLRHGPVDQVQPRSRKAAGNGHAPVKECTYARTCCGSSPRPGSSHGQSCFRTSEPAEPLNSRDSSQHTSQPSGWGTAFWLAASTTGA